jgi:hypothetical protein
MNSATVVGAAQWFLRVALAAGFLSAVADRFGLWGPAGAANVAWGAWQPFVDYVAKLNWFAPPSFYPHPRLDIDCGGGGFRYRLAHWLAAAMVCACRWPSSIVFCHHDDIGARGESTTGLLGIRRCGGCIPAGSECRQGLTKRCTQPLDGVRLHF